MNYNTKIFLTLMSAGCLIFSLTSAFPQNGSSELDDNYIEEEEQEVSDIPKFLSESAVVEVEEGSLMRLYCRLDGVNPTPLMWVKMKPNGDVDSQLVLSGIKLAKNSRMGVRKMDNGDNGEILTIRNFGAKDTGVYECRIMVEKPEGIQFEVKLKEKAEPEESQEVTDDDDESNEDEATKENDDDDGNSAQAFSPSLVMFLTSFLVSSLQHW